jgi:hypothetical protein
VSTTALATSRKSLPACTTVPTALPSPPRPLKSKETNRKPTDKGKSQSLAFEQIDR